jgi:hypothetical protein
MLGAVSTLAAYCVNYREFPCDYLPSKRPQSFCVSLRLEHMFFFEAGLFRGSELDARYGSMKAHYISGLLVGVIRFHGALLGRREAAALTI